MIWGKRSRTATFFVGIGLVGAVLTGCGDDDSDDVVNTAPAVPSQTSQTAQPTGTMEIRIVQATPMPRRGSDGSMSSNRGTPDASPMASPEASPAS